jgi:EAL and modified HD-GYP domain-containing signal transduction protein
MLLKYLKSIIGGKTNREVRPQPIPPAQYGTEPAAVEKGQVIDTGHVPTGNVVTDILPVETSGEPTNSEILRQRFLGRQPLLDRSQHLVGYELLLRHESPAPTSDAEVLRVVHGQTLVKCLIDLDISRLVGGKLALIALPSSMLENPLLLRLPQKGVAFCVDFDSRHDDKLANRCRELKALGYQIALDNYAPESAIESLLSIVQFVRVDVTRFNAIELARLVDKLLEKAPQAHLIGQHVDTEMEFEACHRLFFHYFQGYYFAKLQPAATSRIDSDRVRVMELLNMVKNRAEIPDIEAVFKHDAMLSYKLLLYMNAPVNGLSQEIRSIAHAIIILGYEQLYRWLTLLLFTSGNIDPRSKALLKNALVRARLTELLGQDRFSGKEKDSLFIVGVFSLLDALLNTPIAQAVERLHLSAQITEALVHHSGAYAPYLDLAIACEETDAESISRIAGECGLDAKSVNQAHIQALIWAEDIDL